MKAVVFDRYGPPEVLQLEEVDKPAPGDDEVLIRIRAATVAKADCEMRALDFPFWFRLPLRIMFGLTRPRQKLRILGQEFAGVIEAAGANVRGLEKGDAVFAPSSKLGAHAEYICLAADAPMAPKPEKLSFEEAACLTVFALNALHFVRKAGLEPGQRILINGAGGAMGTIAVQLAKYFGAEVTAVDRAEKLDMLRSIGADHVIDYRKEDFTRSGTTYDVILDVVGRSPYARSIKSLKDGGRYVLANPDASHMLRGLWTSRTSRRKVLFELAKYRTEDLVFLGELAAAGTIRPVIDKRISLAEVPEAHRYIETGRKKGNVVVVFGS